MSQSNKDNKELIIQEGKVIECLPAATFKVRFGDNKEIIAHLSGKMRLNFIKVMVGDRVKVEMSPYDQTKGRIIYRDK